MKTITKFGGLILLCILSLQTIAQTRIVKQNGNWQLLVEEEPYEIKGVTFGLEYDTKNYDTYFKDLQFLGVNTIRTWATGKNTQQLLDTADKYGIKVMVGIWMRHGRPGMEDDDSFNYLKDTEGMQIMHDNALQVVEKYKNHPAVLTWGIGNEVYLNMATDEEKLAYSHLLEKICSQIKQIDPNHPITSVEAWTFGLDWWKTYVPSIDIYGLNSYGQGAEFLANELLKKDIDKPYIITEFGVTGEWDIQQKTNGVIIEPTDTEKYNAITHGYKNWIINKPANLGVFVFHYSTGKDFIAPWLFTHYQSSTRPQYWAIRKAYTGKEPINNVPQIKTFTLTNSTQESGIWLPVTIDFSDTENDSLSVHFAYNQRTGSRKRRDQISPITYRQANNGFEIQLPKVNGATKIYAIVTDSYNNVAIASTGIQINDEQAKNKKYLVPKVQLPFYVYKDGESPYTLSAYMGNYKAMSVSQNAQDSQALQINYKQNYDWFGLGLVDPANDWGNILGGYDISGAQEFSFWARADKKKVTATIGFGLIGSNKPYPDTAKKSIDIKLSTKWKKYTIKTKDLDLSCIRSGLVIFSSGYHTNQNIYINNVVFE